MAWGGGLNELNEWGGVNRKDPNSAPPPTTDLTHLPPLIEPVPPSPSLPFPLPLPLTQHHNGYDNLSGVMFE